MKELLNASAYNNFSAEAKHLSVLVNGSVGQMLQEKNWPSRLPTLSTPFTWISYNKKSEDACLSITPQNKQSSETEPVLWNLKRRKISGNSLKNLFQVFKTTYDPYFMDYMPTMHSSSVPKQNSIAS